MRKDDHLIYENYTKHGFFGTHNPKIGDRVTHKLSGSTGRVKTISTQGKDTYVNFRSENDTKLIKKGEMVNSHAKHINVNKDEDAESLKDADGVEIVNPHVRKFDNDFYLDEYLQRILYNYRKYQNPDGSLNKQKFVQAIDSIWTGTHPRALQNLHQELSKARPDYKPETEFLPYLKNWLKKEALKKIWGRYISIKKGSENAEEKKDSFDIHVDQLKNTSTEELIEDLKELYHIVADEKNVGDYSYDSAQLDIEIIHDILKSRGLDYQKDLAPIWDEIDSQHNSEEAEMPEKDFNKLKQHINKGPIQIKKPIKELPYTHKYINQLAKQDPREGQREEDEERRLDPKCWKGYHKQGTKMKGSKRVNNCVKNEQEEGSYSNVAHDYAERIVGSDVEDPKALAQHYLDNPNDVPEPLQHDVLKQNFNKILQYIDFTVGLNQKRKKEEEYKKKELARGPVHPDPEVGLPGSKQARYKPYYKHNPADYLPRQ